MERNEIFEKLQEIFKDVFDDDDVVIEENTRFVDMEDWDSLTQLNLRVAISKQFNVKLKINELVEIKEVKDIIEVIIKHLGK